MLTSCVCSINISGNCDVVLLFRFSFASAFSLKNVEIYHRNQCPLLEVHHCMMCCSNTVLRPDWEGNLIKINFLGVLFSFWVSGPNV